MHVPCRGDFFITVGGDDYWEIELETNEGEHYFRSRGSMFPINQMLDYKSGAAIELPEWVWKAINNKIEELKIAIERNALDTPEIKNVVV
jgi:hypothetical protein